MFSLFERGIRNTTDCSKITFNKLVARIKDNPYSDTIAQVRAISLSGGSKKQYNPIKEKLAYITSTGVFTSREDSSFQHSSGYVYFDYDDVQDVLEAKRELIEEYGYALAMVCLSSSAKGLSFMVKVDSDITPINYNAVREYIINTYFSQLKLDVVVKDLSRAWFISEDKDVYVNYETCIEIPDSVSAQEKRVQQCIEPKERTNTVKPILDLLPTFSEVIDTLVFETPVDLDARVIGYKPVDYCKVYVASTTRFKDGSKSGAFTSMTYRLRYLNPTVDIRYILGYFTYINEFRTETPAQRVRMLSLICSVLSRADAMTKEELKEAAGVKTKRVHTKKNTIDPKFKQAISSRYAGMARAQESRNKINEVIEQMEEQGIEVYIASVYKFCQDNNIQLGLSTIKRQWKQLDLNVEDEIIKLDEQLEITYIAPAAKQSDTELTTDSEPPYLGILPTEAPETRNELQNAMSVEYFQTAYNVDLIKAQMMYEGQFSITLV